MAKTFKYKIAEKYIGYYWITVEQSGCYWDVKDPMSPNYTRMSNDIKLSMALSCMANHNYRGVESKIVKGVMYVREGFYSAPGMNKWVKKSPAKVKKNGKQKANTSKR